MGVRPIDAMIRLVDNFSKPALKSIQAMGQMSKTSIRIGKDIQKAGKQISDVGAGLTASITLPMAGVAAASVKSFGTVDSSLRLVKETMGAAKWAAGDLEGAMKSAAANSVFTMQEAADAALNFARQGWDAKQAADMLAPALNLAAGTATSLDTITGGLGNTMKAFGASAGEAARYADMMAVAQSQANTDVTSLFEAMGIAGATCNTVGWSFSDLATLTGMFGDMSISATEGATALNTGLMRLASPSKEAVNSMKQLGINVFDSTGKLKDMPNVIGELQNGFKGLTDQQALSAASAIFGKNQASKFLALINGPGIETISSMKNNIEGATGTAQDMSDALLNGVGGSMEKLKSTVDVFKYSVGSLLADTVQPFIEKATNLVDAFNKMDKGQQQNILRMAAVAASVGPAIMVFGKLVSTVGKGIVMFNKAGMALKAAGGVMAVLTSPVGIVIGAIAGLIAVVLIVRSRMDVFRGCLQALSPVFNSVKSHIQSIIAKFKSIITSLSPVLSFFSGAFTGILTAAIGGVVGFVSASVNTVLAVVDSLMTSLQGVIDFVAGVFTGDWERAWNGISSVFSGVFTGIEEICKGVVNSITSNINGVIGGINNMKVPDWVPGIGGKSINIPLIPQLAKGTDYWKGGLVQVHERGGEIIDLPRGSRVYPHDESVEMARAEGEGKGTVINISGNKFVIREEADIKKIAVAIAKELENRASNRGRWTFNGSMA